MRYACRGGHGDEGNACGKTGPPSAEQCGRIRDAWTDPTKRAEDVYRCPCAVGLTYVAADECFMEAASPRCDRRSQLNLGVTRTPGVAADSGF